MEGMRTPPTDRSHRAAEHADREDAELIRRTLAGDQAAFEGLVGRHHGDLLRTLRRITRRVEDAEDAAQEAFLRAYRALDRFDLARPFRPWLWTIGIRLALQGLARKEQRNVSLETESRRNQSAGGAWLADDRSREHIEGRLLRRDVERAL